MAISNIKIINLGSDNYINLMLSLYERASGYNTQIKSPVDNFSYNNGIYTCMSLLNGSLKESMLVDINNLLGNEVSLPKGTYNFEVSNMQYTGAINSSLIEDISRRFNNMNAFLERCKTERSYYIMYSISDSDNLFQSELLKFRSTLVDLGVYERCIFIGKKHSPDIETDKEYNTDLQIWRGTFGKKYVVLNTDNRSLALNQFNALLKSLNT